MKKAYGLLLMLVLCLAALPVLADNSLYYGTWEVKGKVGSTSYQPFKWKVGDQAYSGNVAGQWSGFTGMGWYPFEYVATSANDGYYYTQLSKTGNFFATEGYFIDDGSISGHAGWRDRASLYVDLKGQHVEIDGYFTNPSITDMYKSFHVSLDFNGSYTHADISGTYYDFISRNWRQAITGSMDKL